MCLSSMSAELFFGQHGIPKTTVSNQLVLEEYRNEGYFPPNQIYNHLVDFANGENLPDSYTKTVLVPAETKYNCDICDYRLVSAMGNGYGYTAQYDDVTGLFYTDSSNSLIIHRTDDVSDAAVIGFKIVDDTAYSDYFDFRAIPNGSVYINQLQGPSTQSRQGPILSDIRWNLLLVQEVIMWSKEMGIPYVFLQPAEFSTWTDIRNDFEGRGSMRYNKTAERVGFTRPSEESPYIWCNYPGLDEEYLSKMLKYPPF